MFSDFLLCWLLGLQQSIIVLVPCLGLILLGVESSLLHVLVGGFSWLVASGHGLLSLKRSGAAQQPEKEGGESIATAMETGAEV